MNIYLYIYDLILLDLNLYIYSYIDIYIRIYDPAIDFRNIEKIIKLVVISCLILRDHLLKYGAIRIAAFQIGAYPGRQFYKNHEIYEDRRSDRPILIINHLKKKSS